MLAEAPFLWLDATAWTAIGTLAALAIALGILDWVRTIFRRPKLTFRYDRCSEFSSTVNNVFWLRVPIENAQFKRSAREVEVFLEGAVKIDQSGETAIQGFVPMRLKWSNTEQPSCSLIPPGSFRLLNIGCVELRPQMQIQNDVLEVRFPEFAFGGEVHTEAHAPLAMGVFELAISITAEDMPKKVLKARIVIRRAGERQGQPAKIERA